jgi:hypothetical protein
VFLLREIFVEVVNNCDILNIVFPEKEEDFKTVLTEYQANSSNCLMKGCIDELLAEKKTFNNPMGHLSWMKFQGKRGTKVLVISAYQVSQTSERGLGMETVHMQHWQKLAKTRAKVNPWAKF